MRLLIALTTAASLAFGQAPSPTKAASISGRVLTPTGDPVSGANVTLQLAFGLPPEARTTITNSRGEFLLEDIPAGMYPSLMFGKSGFVLLDGGPHAISLVSGEELRGLVLHAAAGGIVAGKVNDQDGDPAAGAVVLIYRYAYKEGHRSLTPLSKISADDQGNYRFANRPPGRYFLSARGVREISTSQKAADAREIDAQTFFPNALEVENAKPIDLVAGGEIRGADIRLRRSHVYDLHVKIRDSSGATVPSMAFELLGRGFDGNITQKGSGNGDLNFSNLPPGHYILRAFPMPTRPPDQPQHLTGRLDFDIVDHSLDLSFRLSYGSVIDGTVMFEDPATIPPVPEVHQTVMMLNGEPTAINQTGPRMAIVLRERIGNYDATASAGEIQNGKFHVTGLNSGPFLWEVPNLPLGTYVKSIRSGEHDFTNSMVDPSLVNGGLQIVIGAKAADASGSTHGETVTLWPKTPNLGSYSGGVRVATADQHGAFHFIGIAPGEYYLAAWNDLDADLAKSAEFLRQFNSDASPIAIAEGEHKKVAPQLIPAARLAEELAKLP